jgi:alpha-L-fucosidase
VGNERGIAGDPCWMTYDPVGADGGPASPGDVREKESPAGHRHGSKWLPPECDVSIRPGWFWHERENSRVKSPAQLIDLFYKSVGRGANLLLNIPPNREGLLSPEDIASLKAFGTWRRATFTKDLAAHAKTRDDGPDTRTIDLPRPATFNVIRLREPIRSGQRIDGVTTERWNAGSWEQIATATSVGPRRLIRLEKPVEAARLRVRVTASASPAPIELGLFLEPSA